MIDYIWLIPILPLISSITLMLGSAYLGRTVIAILGVGSVGLAAVLTGALAYNFLQAPEPIHVVYWTWMKVGQFDPSFAFYFDGLTLVMMSVITGVGFLIHLFSSEFMELSLIHI